MPNVKGKVTDDAGKGVKAAKVTVTNAAGAAAAAVDTDARGVYNIPNLNPGAYTVSVKAPPGFQDPQPRNVQLNAGQNVDNVDFQLKAGAAVPANSIEFESLRALIESDAFAPEPPINIEEAREFRRLFTVGVYVLARLPESIAKLDEALRNTAQPGLNGQSRLVLIGKQALHQKHDEAIRKILGRMAEDFDNQQALLNEVRQKFNLGTASVPSVNNEFVQLYKEFVTLCADDLMGVDPKKLDENKVVFDAKQREEVFSFLKRVKRVIIRLTQNMSVAGTFGTRPIVKKWSGVLEDSLKVLKDIAENNIASDDKDEKHIWSFVAALNNGQRSTTKAYVVNARDGGALLDYAIEIYKKIQDDNKLDNEEEGYLRDLFHEDDFVITDPAGKKKIKASVVLKERASRVKDNWLPNWA